MPFVLQLASEYVIEITQDIFNGWSSLQHDFYRSFLLENERHFAKIKRKIISYWDCYYRDKYPDIKKYPGYLLSEKLSSLIVNRYQFVGD